jgi:hypothetical protein
MLLLTYQMNHQIITSSLKKWKAIADLRVRLQAISHCSLNVHYRWILKMRDQVIDILPAEGGRYQNTRKKILDLLYEAEKTINADYKRRILVS